MDFNEYKSYERQKLNSIFEMKFEIIKEIGSGGFGTLFKVRDKLDDNIYAIKTN